MAAKDLNGYPRTGMWAEIISLEPAAVTLQRQLEDAREEVRFHERASGKESQRYQDAMLNLRALLAAQKREAGS